MNWFLYLGGSILTLFWSCMFFNKIWHGKSVNKDNISFTVWILNLLAWEFLFIWICHKFLI